MLCRSEDDKRRQKLTGCFCTLPRTIWGRSRPNLPGKSTMSLPAMAYPPEPARCGSVCASTRRCRKARFRRSQTISGGKLPTSVSALRPARKRVGYRRSRRRSPGHSDLARFCLRAGTACGDARSWMTRPGEQTPVASTPTRGAFTALAVALTGSRFLVYLSSSDSPAR